MYSVHVCRHVNRNTFIVFAIKSLKATPCSSKVSTTCRNKDGRNLKKNGKKIQSKITMQRGSRVPSLSFSLPTMFNWMPAGRDLI